MKIIKYESRNCFICGKTFKAKSDEQLFCSIDCSREFKLKKEFQPCKLCGEKKYTKEKYCETCKGSKRSLNKLRFEILKRDNFTCQYCGRNPPEVKLHIDHIIPYSRGGLSIPSNLATSCSDCNLGKTDVLLEEKTLS